MGAHLLLAGEGELRPSLERLARQLGAADRTRFLGVRVDVAELLASADVFVLASLWEGNPLVVMEAMSAGKPVVATAVGCLPELVPASAGELVAPGDDAALARAMARLAGDPGRASAQGAAAQRTARERFDEAVMVAAYERLYAEVASSWTATRRSGGGSGHPRPRLPH